MAAAAACQTGIRDDAPLQTLQSRLNTLEREHERMQDEYQRLRAHHGKQCAASLHSSVKSLSDVIDYVRKADTKLVEWHHRSDMLKTTLRLFGVDRRAHAVIEKGTQKLQDKVERVERKFDRTGVVFDGGLRQSRRLRSGFVDFSTGQVETVAQEVWSTRDAYDQERERVDSLVKRQNSEHERAQAQTEELNHSLHETEQSRENAKWSRTAWSMGTLAGLGAAAVSALVFPPSLVTTVPLLAASAAAGWTAAQYNEQMQNLQTQKQSLDVALAQHDTSVRAMKAELARSSQDRDACSEAIEKVDHFLCQSESLRAESQRSLNELYVVQVVLEKTREKLRIISQELHECRYEETRRGIAVRLRDVLGAMQDVPKKIRAGNAIDIDHAMGRLTEIDERTEEVLQIAQWSAQAHGY